MITLEHLPPPPPIGQVTAYENDGRLCDCQESEAVVAAKKLLGDECYIEVIVGQEPVRSAHSKQEARDAFYAHTETPWQRVMFAYYEEGYEAALNEAVKCEGEGRLHQTISLTASLILKITSFISRLYSLIPSQVKSKQQQQQQQHSTHAIGGSGIGSIMSISWHPHTTTLAALICDDTVRLYVAGHTVSPFLKHRYQKGITHVAWMPLSAGVLGIGCESGVQVWSLDPNSIVGRPSGSCATLLTHPAVTPVVSFTWHPKGNLMAVVGGCGGSVVVWDVWREVGVVVHGGGWFGRSHTATNVMWSPDGQRLLVTYEAKIMRIFETNSWTYEQWNLDSPVQSAVWSKGGHVLLFVTQDDPALYDLTFVPGEGVGGTQVAAQVADLTQLVVVDREGEERSVGGLVKQLVWDPRSERLAVLFRETEFVALFHTHSHPSLHLAPGGFIRGPGCHVPVSASFQQNLSSGAVLSVVWTSGQVTHTPMRFSSKEVRKMNITHHHHHHQQPASPLSLPHLTSPLSPSTSYFTDFTTQSPPLPPLATMFASPN